MRQKHSCYDLGDWSLRCGCSWPVGSLLFHPILNGNLNFLFSFHCSTAPKWLMQFSSDTPRDVPLKRCLSQLWRSSKRTVRKRWGSWAKWKPFLKSSCFTLASDGDVTYHLPYTFRHYKSKALSSRETDHFSFINILTKYFDPAVSSEDYLKKYTFPASFVSTRTK